ncbi:MAG: radical SAM protein [Clostridia bacterium]|nr:radical SAM protein [Clostridia bacterium]
MNKTRHANVALFVPHAGCPHQCSFCNQRHIAGAQAVPSDEAVRAACEEALRTRRAGVDAQIAFFGGSFTAIDRDDMERLLAAAYPYVKRGDFSGIRISTRPDAIDEERLAVLKAYGVTTVELGAQSMDDAVLRRCHRGHTANDVERAAELIRNAGFSLGLQMMTGLPLDTDDGAFCTAERLAALSPDEVRIYPTLVVEGTPLAEEYRAGTYQPQTLEQAVSLCARLLTFFEEERHIPVIRLGLHAEESLFEHCLAGPVHPAFRELCESRLFREKIAALLKKENATVLTVRVHPSCVSRAVGHRRENHTWFCDRGYSVTIQADEAVAYGEIKRGEVVT